MNGQRSNGHIRRFAVLKREPVDTSSFREQDTPGNRTADTAAATVRSSKTPTDRGGIVFGTRRSGNDHGHRRRRGPILTG